MPKVSNLDLGSDKKAIFRGGGGENVKEKKNNNIIFHIFLRFDIFTEEGKKRKGT